MSEPRPRGLGRGLSALLGEPVKTDAAPPKWAQTDANKVVGLPTAAAAPPTGQGDAGPRAIPIDLIQRNAGQPRKHFNEDELNELAHSIRTHGVLQPILVRPIAGGKYEIVAGERRWRAAQRAGLHAIPAVIRELSEQDVLEIAIVENVQRSDLNPIEEAQGFQALIEKFGRTQQEIADAVGKSRPHIANMLRLLALPADLQEMVQDGRLSSGHARAILTAPDPRGLAKRAIEQGLNVREVERLAQLAKDEKHGPRVSGGAAEKDADTRAMEQSLSNALGVDVTINDRGGAGEVKISYKTLEQLDDIARRLRGGS